MSILVEQAHQPLFSNQIQAIKEDNQYHQWIIEENNSLVQQLSTGQEKMKYFLAAGYDAIEFLKKIDDRCIELAKEQILTQVFGERAPLRGAEGDCNHYNQDLLPRSDRDKEDIYFNLETDLLLEKLGWSTEQGRAYLLKHYNKRSRHLLTDEEFFNFAEQLRQLVANS